MTKHPPSLIDVIEEKLQQFSANLNCIQIGRINSYNKSEQSATVEIQVRRRIRENEIEKYPLLLDCPVVFLQGGGSFLEFPIQSGDYCLVLFNDRDIDNWWTTANVTEPKTRRKHNLSDGFCLVGINPKTKVLSLDGSAVQLNGLAKKIKILNNAESLYTLMGDMIDAISGIITVGSSSTQSVSPASQAELVAIKTRFGSLLS